MPSAASTSDTPVTVSQDVLSNILSRLSRLEELERGRKRPSSSVRSNPDQADSSQTSSVAGLTEHQDSPTSLPRLIAEATSIAKSSLRNRDGALAVPVQNQRILKDLESVYAEMRQFEHRPRTCLATGPSTIPKELVRKWADVYFDSFEVMPTLIPMTREYTISIAELIEVPHVSVDTSALLIYYNILFQGMLMDESSIHLRATYSSYLYRQSLRLLENWEERDEPLIIDFHAALLMSWMACEKLDANLAWRLHCRACRVGRDLGYFMLDAVGEASQLELYKQTDMAKRDVKNRCRYSFWQLQAMDNFFRLHFNKPRAIQPGTWTVNFPCFQSEIRVGGSQQAFEVNFLVTMRLAFVSIKFFEHTDNNDGRDPESLTAFNTLISSLVKEIDFVLKEWDIVSSQHFSKEKGTLIIPGAKICCRRKADRCLAICRLVVQQ